MSGHTGNYKFRCELIQKRDANIEIVLDINLKYQFLEYTGRCSLNAGRKIIVLLCFHEFASETDSQRHLNASSKYIFKK